MQVITRLPEIQERNRPAESLGACCCDCFVCNIRFTSFFVRGRRQGRQPLNPGAGPAPVSSPEAFGGNRRLYTAAPPAADPPRTYLVSIPVHDYRCNLQCILRVVFKNLVFYRVLWPSLATDFVLATLKNYGFFMVLGVRRGSGTETLTSWRRWRQHRAQHRANIGQVGGFLGQHKAKMGATMRQRRADMGQ